MKTEKRGRFNEKGRERSVGIDREEKRSSSVDRSQWSENRNGNGNGNGRLGKESDYDEENESDSNDDHTGNYNNSSSEKKRSRDTRRISNSSQSYRNQENERGRERGSEDETKVAVQAMKRELSNIREEIDQFQLIISKPFLLSSYNEMMNHFLLVQNCLNFI